MYLSIRVPIHYVALLSFQRTAVLFHSSYRVCKAFSFSFSHLQFYLKIDFLWTERTGSKNLALRVATPVSSQTT